jgi:hypothetical protein
VTECTSKDNNKQQGQHYHYHITIITTLATEMITLWRLTKTLAQFFGFIFACSLHYSFLACS